MASFAHENGPYVNEDGDPGFRRNDYAWNQETNLINIDSPAGVGYSVCGDPKECDFDDNNSADDNLQVVLAVLQLFDQIKDNDLYIAGESYAGVYVPKLI